MLTSPEKSLVYFESDKLCIADGALIRSQMDVKCCTRMGASAQLCVQVCDVICQLSVETGINPLNAKLNPICHLLSLFGAHHILHVSR